MALGALRLTQPQGRRKYWLSHLQILIASDAEPRFTFSGIVEELSQLRRSADDTRLGGVEATSHREFVLVVVSLVSCRL